jgi:hypothetical protein
MTSLEPLIPISLFLTIGAVSLMRGPFGQAIVEQMRGKSPGSPALEAEVAQLRIELDDLRHALVETQERLDFTERLLARTSEASPPPMGS